MPFPAPDVDVEVDSTDYLLVTDEGGTGPTRLRRIPLETVSSAMAQGAAMQAEFGGGGGGGGMTANQILTALLTVDGPGSLLDADLLDGNSSAAFALAAHDHAGVYQPLDSDLTALAGAGNSAVLIATDVAFTTAKDSKLNGIEALATADMTAAEILAALLTVDGAGTGLDADLLDGLSSAAFAVAGHTHAGVYQPVDADLTTIAAANNGTTLAAVTAAYTTAEASKLAGIEALATADQTAAELLAKLLTVDGTGSGLDADLLDGLSSAAFAVAAHNHTGTYQPLATVLTNTTASYTTAEQTKLAGIETAATADMTAAEILTALLTVDGSGSLLDADLLDGLSSAAFALAGHNHTGTYQPLDADLTSIAAANNGTTLAAVTAAYTTAEQTKLSGIDTGAQVRAWDNSLADLAVSGITTQFTAGTGGVVLGDVCYISSTGTLIKADSDAIATSAVVAMATGTIAAASTGTFLLQGIVRNDAAYAFTPGGLIYSSGTPGGITQTAPVGVNGTIVVIGVAINADKWLFMPNLVMVEHV